MKQALNSGFLYSLFFDAEDGGDLFLRRFNALSADYTTSYLRSYNSPFSAR
jgi:hypothetical protein